MVKLKNRLITILLLIVMVFEIFSSCFVVLADDTDTTTTTDSSSTTNTVQNRNNSFINFMGSNGEMSLSMADLTTTDYYTMLVFLSNWFRPGMTTLKQLVEADGPFVDEFSQVLNLGNSDNLKPVIKTLGSDIVNGINTGKCILLNEDGSPLSGDDFLYSIVQTTNIAYNKTESDKFTEAVNSGSLDEFYDYLKSVNFFSSKVYYGSTSNLAIDFSDDSMRAAFQTLFAIMPDLFLSSKGIESLDVFYIDAVGNIWGGTKESLPDNYNLSTEYKMGNSLNTSKLDQIYLVMPACINPSAFTPNVKDKSSQSELRMPLMNRFTLSAILPDASQLNVSGSSDFQSNFIPIYNLFADSTSALGENNALTILGINTLSPYTFNTQNIESNSWNLTARKKALADFVYKPTSFSINRQNSKNGKSDYDSNSFIVFAMNPFAINFNNKDSGGSLDLQEGFFVFQWFGGGDFAFSSFIKRGADAAIGLQKSLLIYFFSPTTLTLDRVSMNSYTLEPLEADENGNFDTGVVKDLTEGNLTLNTNGALTSAEATKLGLTGMSLYLDDVTASDKVEVATNTDEVNYYVTPTNMVNSKLVQLLLDMYSAEGDINTYNTLKQKGYLESTNTLNTDFFTYLYLKQKYDSTSKKLVDLGTIQELDDSFKMLGDNFSIFESTSGTGVSQNTLMFRTGSSKTEAKLYLHPSLNGVLNVGNNSNDITVSRLIGFNETTIRNAISAKTNDLKNNVHSINISVNTKNITDYILALYGYSLFFPSKNFKDFIGVGTSASWGGSEYSMMGSTEDAVQGQSGLYMKPLNSGFGAGVYLGYVVDMMGLGTCDAQAGLGFGAFSSPFLPKYNISAKGGNLSLDGVINGITGVDKSEDLSFEQKQKDLINRIYGLTNDQSNDYRNSLIKNILEGFILTVHRTITGTWGAGLSEISTGSSSTYQSLTGYIYTPTLEELPFTLTIMESYIKIYVLCMIVIIFMLVLMIFLHMRTIQQGAITLFFMFVALLFPYVLISNTINISNRISNNIYSDRFDFWAMTEHFQSLQSLSGYDFMDDKDKWLAEASATDDSTLIGQTGVKIKWMSPKKVDMFQNIYSDSSYSETFATNLTIFRWLFNSTIYDSEFVDNSSGSMSSYVYRPYKTIAVEAESYYRWGASLVENSDNYLGAGSGNLNYNGGSYSVTNGFRDVFDSLQADSSIEFTKNAFIGAIGRQDNSLFNGSSGLKVKYSDEKLEDLDKVSQFNIEMSDSLEEQADNLGQWGMFSTEVLSLLTSPDYTNTINPGVYSNLPSSSSDTSWTAKATGSEISKAIYLKNTESPFYYFYSVLKSRYGDTTDNPGRQFRQSLLNNELFKVKDTETNPLLLNGSYKVVNTYRDFLDLEGLFEYVIPYLKASNDYVINWQMENKDLQIETYNFKYEVYDADEAAENNTVAGDINMDTIGKDSEGSYGAYEDSVSSDYVSAVQNKNAMNRVWNMYSPWVDALYSTDIYGKNVSVGGSKINISDTLNPSSYLLAGRPMIFSEAEMIVKGYTYKDLTEVERKIQAVTEKTYNDLLYLVNYYDMDNEVLLCAAAMYATFNFNSEFSQDSLLGNSIVIYPQGFELKNFNYDAFMRLALLNSTGETLFSTTDLYERVLTKTSIFTGLVLLICDLIACIAIPFFKFIILIGLFFLGILICLACVINPPEKIFESINKSLLLPTVLFMALNIVFSWVMSLVIGEGLTAYVGSKTINFVTNDPTITMIIMAFLGIAYLFCAFKILKFLVEAYKKFGMSTALAAVGIVGAAVAAGTSGVAKKVTRTVGSGVGAGIGAATAEKGHRLAGAFEGGKAGSSGIIDRRIRERRMRELQGGKAGSPSTTSKIDSLASKNENSRNSKLNNNTDNNHSTQNTTTNVNNSTSEPPSELDRGFKKATNKNTTILGAGLSNVAYAQEKAKDALRGVRYKKEQIGTSLRGLKLDAVNRMYDGKEVLRNAPNKVKETVGNIKGQAKNYMQRSVKDYRDDKAFYQLVGSEREKERIDRLAQKHHENFKKDVEIRTKKRNEFKRRQVDHSYDKYKDGLFENSKKN